MIHAPDGMLSPTGGLWAPQPQQKRNKVDRSSLTNHCALHSARAQFFASLGPLWLVSCGKRISFCTTCRVHQNHCSILPHDTSPCIGHLWSDASSFPCFWSPFAFSLRFSVTSCSCEVEKVCNSHLVGIKVPGVCYNFV